MDVKWVLSPRAISLTPFLNVIKDVILGVCCCGLNSLRNRSINYSNENIGEREEIGIKRLPEVEAKERKCCPKGTL